MSLVGLLEGNVNIFANSSGLNMTVYTAYFLRLLDSRLTKYVDCLVGRSCKAGKNNSFITYISWYVFFLTHMLCTPNTKYIHRANILTYTYSYTFNEC